MKHTNITAIYKDINKNRKFLQCSLKCQAERFVWGETKWSN